MYVKWVKIKNKKKQAKRKVFNAWKVYTLAHKKDIEIQLNFFKERAVKVRGCSTML